MKKLTFDWKQSLFLLLFFSLIATVILLPLFSNSSLPITKDYINHLAAITQAKIALTEGQFPLRVAPLEWNQWRYPFFQFYSSSTYTFAGWLYLWLPISNPFVIYKLTIWIALLLGEIYMYRLTYWVIQSRSAAIFASVVYLFSPYTIFSVNFFGSFNEVIALGILPIVIYYTAQRYYYPKDKSLLVAALMWYLLATIHSITFILSSFFIGLLFLLLTLQNKQWKNAFAVFIAYIFGCFLAMWQLGPIILFGEHYFNTGFENQLTYDISPSLWQMLSVIAPTDFTAISGSRQFFSFVVPAPGLPILIAAFFWFYMICKNLSPHKKEIKHWLLPLIILFFIAFFIVWSPINFWQWLPSSFVFFQFTWRALGQMMWVGALLFAAMNNWIFKSKLTIPYTIFLSVLVMLASSTWLLAKQDTIPFNAMNFEKHPVLIQNAGNYLMYLQKYRPYLNITDSVMLETLKQDHSLKLNTSYLIDPHLFKEAYSPFISIEGTVPELLTIPDLQIQAVVNGIVIATYPLNPGKFYWKIPLSLIPLSLREKPPIALQFKTNQTAVILVDKILLSGLLNPKKTLFLSDVQPFCQQKGITTDCEIKTANNTELLMLPVLFYPSLINVTLNGQSIPYQSVFYEDRIILGITPKPNALNHIEVTFQGLMWANFISQIAWGLWGLFCLYLLLRTWSAPKLLKR